MSDALLNEAWQRHRAGDHASAERLYKDVLAREPRSYAALYRLGFLYGEQGAFEEAARLMGEAVALNPAAADAHFLRGSALLQLKRDAEAVTSFDRAVALDPKLTAAWFNRAVALVAMKHFAPALESVERALALGAHTDALVTKGVALKGLGRAEEAKACYDAALALDPNCIDALVNRATIHFEAKHYEEAGADCEAALALDPALDYMPGFLLHFRLHCCDWRDYEEQRRRITKGIAQGRRVIQPLMNLAVSESPEDQLQCARIWAESECRIETPPLWNGEHYTHKKLRIAYLSEDFRTHPVAQAIAGVLEHHDRSRVEVMAISLGPDDGSALRARIARASHRFVDAAGESDEAVARLLRAAEIDIAVDLMGYTGTSRSKILPHRVAPVQVSFLGFAGTMGRKDIDYLIADDVVVPEREERHYKESLVRLPGTFMPVERRVLPHIPSRAEAGLPPEGFVFACFNNAYKIAPRVFQVWMRLLLGVPGSVLWLGNSTAAAQRNLWREAEGAKVDPERLIFAPRLPGVEDHLARLALADLFFDTLPQNAHSTVADALSAGLPVLTAAGSTFAGRVAASILQAAGLSELVTHSLTEYEARALDLARDADALKAIRAKLATSSAGLFDQAGFARNLEAAYETMAARTREGLPPAAFAVSR